MLHLPKPIAAYFALPANAGEAAIAEIFAEDAVVADERAEHRGRAAIVAWRRDVMARTPFTNRPLSMEQRDGIVVVPTAVSGVFPGSPIVLDHHFTLEGEQIAGLEIK